MIEVSVNNDKTLLPAQTSVADMLASCGFEGKKVAVAVNSEFVPRSVYAQQELQAGDAIDVLAPVQGG